MSIESIVIYGAGGFGRELAWLVEECRSDTSSFKVECLIDDNTNRHGEMLNDIPVMSFLEAREKWPHAKVLGAIANPRLRQKLMEKSMEAGFAFATLVHPRVERSRWISIGEGSVICAGTVLTTNITIGRHVQINLDCTIGHDAVLDDYATLAPGVHVSGCVHIGKRVYIGTGAVLLNGTRAQPLVVENDAVIGAGACVTRPVREGTTVVGVPAKPRHV